MTTVIEDGRTGNTAEVDVRNRLRTMATTQSDSTNASLEGDTFFLTYDIVNLNYDSEFFIFHLSDNYSYLDQSAEELSAKGNGGTRQMHSYCTITQNDIIATPPDDYEPNKIGEVDLGKLQMERANEDRQKR